MNIIVLVHTSADSSADLCLGDSPYAYKVAEYHLDTLKVRKNGHIASKKRSLPSEERLIRDEFIDAIIVEIRQFLGGNLQLSSEKRKNSSEL